MKTREVQKLYQEYLLPTYSQAPLCLVRGKGARVWDIENREYLDFFSGWAVSGLGHCHPAVVNAVRDQLKKIMHIPNNYLNLKQAQLAKEISKSGFSSRSFFCNSGTEATEAAVKFARRYGSESGRYEIITMKLSFHGRTFAGIAATGQEKVRDGFGPHLKGFRYAELNDLASVGEQITDKTIAIFLEPIQGEGGVRAASQEFMLGLRKLCDKKDLLLILDEVQTGMGRSGKMFAYQHYKIEPDVMTLAKSLGNGVAIGALVVNNKIKKEVFTPGSHGSTFGGNPLAAAAALAVFREIKKKKLLAQAKRLGDYFESKLKDLQQQFEVIEDVCGYGLMRGLKLNESGVQIAEKAREKGLLINCTQDKILRIFPPMTLSKTLLDKGLAILKSTMEEIYE